MDLSLSKFKVGIILALVLMLGFASFGMLKSNRSQALSECSAESELYDPAQFTSAAASAAHAACASSLEKSRR